MRDPQHLTITLVVIVSIIATAIGVQNFERFLNTMCLIDTMPTINKHCK